MLVVDIPCDVQGPDHEGCLWAFLDEAARPAAVIKGALVVTGHDEAPVIARVLRLEDRPGGRLVTMELVATAAELEQVLLRARNGSV